MIYIISQIFGALAFIIALISYHRKTKKEIFGTMILCHILNIIHYFLLGAFSGLITKILALFRDYFILLKDKYPKLSNIIYLYIFIMIYIISMVFTYKGIISLFPLLAASIYIFFIWNGNALQVKKAAFSCYFLWLIYNICVFSIAGVISNIISIMSTFIAIINAKRVESK